MITFLLALCIWVLLCSNVHAACPGLTKDELLVFIFITALLIFGAAALAWVVL